MANKSEEPIALPAADGTIDSRRLMIFYHVARTGSLSKAEGSVYLAQSAISRHIMRLEEDLGVALLERHGRGVTLTPFGEILYKQAEVILQEMAVTLEQIAAAKRRPTGRVSIAASAIVMSQFMPEILTRLMNRYPEIEVVAVQAASGEVYSSLVSGKVDVAIVMIPPNRHRYDVDRLLEEPMLLIAAKDHPIASNRVVTRKQLAEQALVLPAAPFGMRTVIEDYAREGNVELQPRLHADSVPLMRETVAKGRLCVILPQLSFVDEFDSAKFVGFPLDPPLTRTLYVASRKSDAKSLYIHALTETVKDVFAEKAAFCEFSVKTA